MKERRNRTLNTGGEAADQVIRMTLNGAEVALKITGVAAKEVAAMLYAILKENKKSKGRTRLESLVKSGKPLTVFTVKVDDFEQFKKEAKRYGVLYSAVKNARSNHDGMVDIMVKQEDASRIDRIVERFRFADVSKSAEVESDIRERKASKKLKTVPEQAQPEKSENEKVMEKLFSKPLQKEENETNPKMATTTKSRPSEPILKPTEREPIKLPKPSVKKELSKIKAEQEKKAVDIGNDNKTKNKVSKMQNHQKPKTKKSKRKER